MTAVVAALIQRDGRLLICQRRADDRLALKWEFPGGKIAPGESPEQALSRELEEELGVSASIGREVYRTRHEYRDADGVVELMFFTAEISRAQPRNLAFEKIEWVEPERLTEYDFLPADRELIQYLAAGRLHL
jgi:8-oxo-dGTP diphosphatase